MNTLDSYLFTDIDLAKEAADYRAKRDGVSFAVMYTPSLQTYYAVTMHSSHTAYKNHEVLYIAEPPE